MDFYFGNTKIKKTIFILKIPLCNAFVISELKVKIKKTYQN